MGRLQHRTAPGFTYFVTTKTWQNRGIFQVTQNAESLVECLQRYRNSEDYLLHEFMLPNHLHLLITPTNDISLEKIMQLIKGGSSHDIHQQTGRKMQIWQPGFHEESVRDMDDFLQKRKYIHNNPVHARLVKNISDWCYGSAANSFQLNAPTERLRICSSVAEARRAAASVVSELKLRPPKVRTHGGPLC